MTETGPYAVARAIADLDDELGCHPDQLASMISDALAAAEKRGAEREREACAALADAMQEVAARVLQDRHDDDAAAQHDTAMEIAEAIRARSQPDERGG